MNDGFASFGSEETTTLPDSVRANDIDPDSDPLNITLDTDVSNGNLVLNTDGSFTYTPDADWSGTDSFTYIANVVHGNLLAADAPEAPGKVFNVACNGSVTVNHLAEEIGKLTGRTDLKPIYGPDRSGDVKHSRASIEKARKTLGYEPVVSFEEGLKRTVDFYLKHGF